MKMAVAVTIIVKAKTAVNLFPNSPLIRVVS
jgi:hypothetical protein